METVVKYHPNTRQFLVEEPPLASSEPELSIETLQLRVQQQQILADFGVLALQGTPFAQLLDEASRCAAKGLGADFAKVLQYQPGENRFLVCAGVGWADGVVGEATIGADSASPAGYALKTGRPVISNHLEIEERFRTPELLARFGIRRAMNVILAGDGAPFGVLEVDSRSEGEFSRHDLVFLHGLANIIGMAIERQRMELNLRRALERQQMLAHEVNHRVNNSLQIVAGMLQLHAAGANSEELRHELRQAGTRITAVARAHQRLYSGDEISALDLGAYLREVCRDTATSMPDCEVEVSAAPGLMIRTDRAVPAVLLVNELIVNAVKYAYPGGHCKVRVTLSLQDNRTAYISVRDEGVGLPADFNLAAGRLGMRLARSFAQQLEGELEVTRHQPGAEFVLRFPLVP